MESEYFGRSTSSDTNSFTSAPSCSSSSSSSTELTREEFERFRDALKDESFRKLLEDYAREVTDPENVRLYQREITQLEKERGVDVTFINPVPAYVIKTSVDGVRKAFINVCTNEHVGGPTYCREACDGRSGVRWSLPHSLAPPRDDVDARGVRCRVFDVVFHTDTLHLAKRNQAFREMVDRTACDAVETSFEVKLDRRNLKYPRLRYKGLSRAAVVRKKSADGPPTDITPEEKRAMDEFFTASGIPEFPPKPKEKAQSSPKRASSSTPVTKRCDSDPKYTVPKYIIKHRRHVELEEFTDHKTSKINAATPKELVVEVELPLLRASSDMVLDVAEKTLQLTSEKPAKYKLSLTLPYQVNQDAGNAKFDKDKKRLIVILPVKRLSIVGAFLEADSGVESDHAALSPASSSPASTELDELSCSPPLPRELHSSDSQYDFLEHNLQYTLPEYTCGNQDDTLVFTLMVKNVIESSIVTSDARENSTDFHVKFTSVSPAFYSLHCSFFVRLPNTHAINWQKTSAEAWDNNVIVQIGYEPCDKPPQSYKCGINENDLLEKHFETKAVMLQEDISKDDDVKTEDIGIDVTKIIENDEHSETSEFDDRSSQYNSSGTEDPEPSGAASHRKKERAKKKNRRSLPSCSETEDDDEKSHELPRRFEKPPKKPCSSLAIDIARSYPPPESSGDDEISRSYSPSKSSYGGARGILRHRHFGRSMSESGIDDVGWASSMENCFTSVDSVIPEEEGGGYGEQLSTSLKKTVRFSDVVSRQLFRSNSSILGQRKKNQRKAKAKKRAHDRRHSESEVLLSSLPGVTDVDFYRKEKLVELANNPKSDCFVIDEASLFETH